MLRTRLLLGLLPLLLVTAGIGVWAIAVCSRLARTIQTDIVRGYESYLACEDMRREATEMHNAVAAEDGVDPARARAVLRRARSAFGANLMKLSASAAGTARLKLVTAVDDAFRRLSAQEDQILDEGGAGSLEGLRRNEDALYRLGGAIVDLEHYDYAVAETAEARARSLAARTVRLLIVAMAVAFVLGILLAFRLAASLLRPIRALTASAVALGEGDLSRSVPELSRDELGRLAGAFNTMASKLRAYREATAARVLRAQRTMEATLTSAPDPVFVVTREGAPELRNPAAERLARSSAVGRGLPPELSGPLSRVLESGQHYLPADYRNVVTLRVGREDRHYLPRILAIGDRLTEFSGAAVILQDVTKFRLLDDAKTNLVGTVSHELKTPLTSLRMAVYLLLEQPATAFTPVQRDLLETARDEADRLLRIIDDLLDLTRLESGAAALSLRPCGASELLDEIARDAASRLAREQRLELRCEAGLGAVRVDIDRLRHVFLNFLTNSAKYGDPKGVITLYAAKGPPGLVRFGVRDQGAGIPPECLPRIFDRFYRVPGSPKTGAGLGLAIAREIVIAHGGSIGCASGPGEGSDFHFDLPASPPAPEESESAPKPPPQAARS